MNRHVLVCLAALIVGTASWAYNVNYKTITVLEQVDSLRADIALERETLQVLRVEWAYLNAPERLASLVERHQDRLALVPLVPEALGEVAVLPFPKGRTPGDMAESPLALAPGMPLPEARPASWAAQ